MRKVVRKGGHFVVETANPLCYTPISFQSRGRVDPTLEPPKRKGFWQRVKDGFKELFSRPYTEEAPPEVEKFETAVVPKPSTDVPELSTVSKSETAKMTMFARFLSARERMTKALTTGPMTLDDLAECARGLRISNDAAREIAKSAIANMKGDDVADKEARVAALKLMIQ